MKIYFGLQKSWTIVSILYYLDIIKIHKMITHLSKYLIEIVVFFVFFHNLLFRTSVDLTDSTNNFLI
jgi:hypothetical protein